MAAQIIFLHGASSSGKSTLARAIQHVADRPFLHLSIDHLRDSGVVPPYGAEHPAWRDMRAPLFDGFHRAIAGFAAAGNNIVLEHILDTPGWDDQLQRLLAPYNVLFVAVHCPLAELVRREAARGDRPLGSAAQDFQQIHTGRTYDLEVDGTAPASVTVARILAALAAPRGKANFTTKNAFQ